MALGLYLAFLALVGLWLLLRITLFFSDRIGSVTMPPDLYPICTWMLRLILITVAGGVAFIALPGAVFGISMGDAFGGTRSYGLYAVILGVGLYALSAIILNFPFFPLPLHEKLFLPIHFALLPCLLLLPHLAAFLTLCVLLLLFHFLWRLCLPDRQKYG
jgi:hypothetical protein